MNLYAYVRPVYASGHRFSDDVALTMAQSHEVAVEKFSVEFDRVNPLNVRPIEFDRQVVRL